MSEELARVFQFLHAVFINWIVLLGGAVMIVLGVFERLWRKEVHWRFYAGILAALLFVAFYLSWRQQLIAVEAKPKTPKQFVVTETDPQARADLAKTKTELSETQEKLSAANKAIEALKNRAEDRTIPATERDKLIKLLATAPKGKVIIKADLLNGEAERFAAQIQAILTEVGFEVSNAGPTSGALHGHGVYMFVKDITAPHLTPLLSSRLFEK
jgi:hypothetical protein